MQCAYVKETGDRCKAIPINDDKYCFWHSSKISEEEKQIARSKGGKTHRTKNDTPLEPVDLLDVKDVVNLIGDAINRVRSGEMEIRVANCLGYLSGQALKALEISELERRLEVIEERLLNHDSRVFKAS